jgi:hypothetical protein
LLTALEPQDSLSEILFGLIMVLTFTLGASVAAGGDAAWERTLVIGAIGCNVAWGVIDGVFHVMGELFVRSRRARLLRALRAAASETAGLAVIRHEFDPQLVAISREGDREALYHGIYGLLQHATPKRTGLRREDLVAALAVFILVTGAALPAALPFLFVDDSRTALRISNFLLIGLLFLVGYRWARFIDANPWLVALGLTAMGLILVAIAIMLGG